MRFLKTAVLILSVVSAEFALQTANVVAAVKNTLQRTAGANMLPSLQAGERRLDNHQGPGSEACYSACSGASFVMTEIGQNYAKLCNGCDVDYSVFCRRKDIIECMVTKEECKESKEGEAGWVDGKGMKGLHEELGKQCEAETTSSGSAEESSAMMSPECMDKCPKLTEMMTAMAGIDDSQDMAKVMEATCPHEETLTCLISNDVCKDGNTESFSMILCMCACPSMTSMGEMDNDAPTADQCKAMNCVLGADASKCGGMQKMSKDDKNAQKAIDNCKANHGDQMTSSGGSESAQTDASQAAIKAVPAVLLIVSVVAPFA
eukprot:gnl/MRDRNA2_/MRDRNA2_90924_c0_seq1.p1 gnl/MRDRNA2_/MRDRNA2_90924_c0~~gnl/MRDRNA2_/MRDRNA2_90924_c0_seq1.p1  ORF type:complete len:319 (-),score=61.14 gnl/MRDRNA2_/MRDRNA2_90924_c0_seq1:374-1330(-)